MYNNDKVTFKLPDLLDEKLLILHGRSFGNRHICNMQQFNSALNTSNGILAAVLSSSYTSSAENISGRAEWLRHSGRAPSEPSETPQWRITLCRASRPLVASHIALRSPFHCFFSICRSPILNKHYGVVAYCDHTSEWVHWVHACIGIAMQSVTLQKSLLAFLLH